MFMSFLATQTPSVDNCQLLFFEFLPLLFSSVIFLHRTWWVHTAEEVLMDLLAIRLGNEPAMNLSMCRSLELAYLNVRIHFGGIC